MNCGTCAHWNPVGDLAKHGHGQCEARPEPYRTAISTSAQAQCRIGKFQQAKPQQLRQRENAGGLLL